MAIYGRERGKLMKKRNIALFLLMLCICLLAGCSSSIDAAAEYEALMTGETVCIPCYNNYSHTSQYLTIDAEEKTVTLRWSYGFYPVGSEEYGKEYNAERAVIYTMTGTFTDDNGILTIQFEPIYIRMLLQGEDSSALRKIIISEFGLITGEKLFSSSGALLSDCDHETFHNAVLQIQTNGDQWELISWESYSKNGRLFDRVVPQENGEYLLDYCIDGDQHYYELYSQGGLLLSRVLYQLIPDEYDNFYDGIYHGRDEFYYDESGNCIKQVIYGGDYDHTDMPIQVLQYSADGETEKIILYSYNDDGRMYKTEELDGQYNSISYSYYSYYDSGAISEINTYTEAGELLTSSKYYENGQLFEEDGVGYYESGNLMYEAIEQEDGTIKRTEYSEYGDVESVRISTKSGLIQSLTYFYGNGQIQSEELYYPNGKIQKETRCNLTVQFGYIREYDKEYYENGKCKHEILYYENGQIRSDEWFFENGKRQKYTQYSQNGLVTYTDEYYSNGNSKTDSSYFDNGNLKISSEFYENGNDKTLTTYYSNGQLKSIWEYGSDGKHQKSRYYYESGKLEETVEYGPNETLLSDICYYESGKIRSITERDDAGIITSTSYYESGQIEFIQQDDANGNIQKTTRYYENGQIEYINEYNENGVIKTSTNYLENGNISHVAEYDENQKIKKYTSYHYYENGQLKEVCESDENGRSQKLIIYYENGQIHQKSVYDETTGCTTTNLYSESGKLSSIIEDYENGQRKETHYYLDGQVHYAEYDKDGNLISET